MSIVLFSKTFVERINAKIRRFWWARVQEDNHTSPIASGLGMIFAKARITVGLAYC
jgi:hypothetical protein